MFQTSEHLGFIRFHAGLVKRIDPEEHRGIKAADHHRIHPLAQMILVRPFDFKNVAGHAALAVRLHRRLVCRFVEAVERLAGQVIPLVPVPRAGTDAHVGRLRTHVEEAFRYVALSGLHKLPQRMQIFRILRDRRKNAAQLLAFALAEQLPPPLAQRQEGRLEERHDLDVVPLLI
jgi:hypothetical protein